MSVKRVNELDGFRGLACVGVLTVHLFLFRPDSPLANFLLSFILMGSLGMDMFFVLSGYLITGILMRSQSDPHYYRNFYARRFLRIFPAYYLVLLVTIFVVPLFSQTVREAQLVEKLPWFLLYMQNWYIAISGHPFAWQGVDHFWSLAIEEQFYLLWPLVVLLMPVSRFRKLCLLVIALSLLSKLALSFAGDRWVWMLYLSTPTRIDGIIYGALIATLSAQSPLWVGRTINLLGWVGVAVLCILIATGPYLHSVPFLVISVVCATFISGAVIFRIHSKTLNQRLLNFFRSGFLTWLGRYSYGIYLIHNVVHWLVIEAIQDYAPLFDPLDNNAALILAGLITLFLSIPLALLMYRYIEGPLLRQGHRFQPQPASGSRKPASAAE